MSNTQDILVENIDVELLRQQRDELFQMLIDIPPVKQERLDMLQGLVNLLDAMIDIAEGY